MRSARWTPVLSILVLASLAGPAVAEESGRTCEQQFREALELFAQARDREVADPTAAREAYERSAAAGVEAADRCPGHRDADRVIYNAAIGYEEARRHQSAAHCWRRLVDAYPQSPLVDSARFRLAYGAYRLLEFEAALNHFAILARTSRDGDIRRDSILNTATILTNLQQYTKAAPYWRMYAEPGVAPDLRTGAEAAFRAAEMAHKSGDRERAVTELRAFVTEYRAVAAAGAFRVRAAHLAAQALAQQDDAAEHRRALEAVVGEFRTSGERPGGRSAAHAAEARFLLVDGDMERLEQLKCGGTADVIKARVAAGVKQVADLELAYKTVTAYRSPEWTVAATTRTGKAYELLGACLVGAGPTDMAGGRDSERDLQKRARALHDRATAQYELALRAARQSGVATAHSSQAEAALARLRPSQYRRIRPGKVRLNIGGVAPGELATWPGEGGSR